MYKCINSMKNWRNIMRPCTSMTLAGLCRLYRDRIPVGWKLGAWPQYLRPMCLLYALHTTHCSTDSGRQPDVHLIWGMAGNKMSYFYVIKYVRLARSVLHFKIHHPYLNHHEISWTYKYFELLTSGQRNQWQLSQHS